MKINKLYDGLINIISLSGVIVRKDILKAQGGYCLLDNNKLIILNKILPIENHCRILARCIGELDILSSEIFIAPALREYIENEVALSSLVKNVEISIKHKNLSIGDKTLLIKDENSNINDENSNIDDKTINNYDESSNILNENNILDENSSNLELI